MQPTPYDVTFSIFRFPVRIQPFFWVIVVLFGIRGEIDDMATWMIQLAIWVSAVLLSLLVHELGHAFVFRHIFHVRSRIVLQAFGGATIPECAHQKKRGWKGLFSELLLATSGALAGFALAGIALMCLSLLKINENNMELLPLTPLAITQLFCLQVAFISIFWGVFNLLPIHPMDGGIAMREIFVFFSPQHGLANSLGLSIVVAIAVALFAFQFGLIFATVILGLFAYQNFRELKGRFY
ncbi:MAG: hypothetical protein ACRC2T_06065 [Thermoguttaceae bacterium]